MADLVHADAGAVVLDRLRALPHGARLLAALDEPAAAAPDAPGDVRPGGALDGVHLVGGAVRDLLLERVPAELDLVAERDAAAVADALRRRLGGRARTHDRFGTATFATDDGLRVDVATARAEDYPRPGALPVVRPGSLDEDLRRRDFTVNAVAVGVSGESRGELRQAPGALGDLAARQLRVLHDRSFVDDPTRLLRLVRYAARLGFAVEERTEALARAAFASGAPATAGVARMGRELLLVLEEPVGVSLDALRMARSLGGGQALEPLVLEEEPMRRAADLLPGERKTLVLLAAATRKAERSRLAEWLAGIHLREAGVVLDATEDPDALAAAMRAARRASDLHRLLRDRTDEAVALAGALGAEDAARRWFGSVRHVRLAITGDDLLRAGVPQGREVGARLDAALAAKLDGAVRAREEELAAALAADV